MRADEARVADDEKPQAAVAFRAFRAPVATANMTIPVADTVAHARLAYNEGANLGRPRLIRMWRGSNPNHGL